MRQVASCNSHFISIEYILRFHQNSYENNARGGMDTIALKARHAAVTYSPPH